MKNKPEANEPKVLSHTPTPWRIEREYGEIEITSELGQVARIESVSPSAQADAAFIVRAVNAHEELIASIKDAIVSIENGAGLYAASGLKDALRLVDETIAKAERGE